MAQEVAFFAPNFRSPPPSSSRPPRPCRLSVKLTRSPGAIPAGTCTLIDVSPFRNFFSLWAPGGGTSSGSSSSTQPPGVCGSSTRCRRSTLYAVGYRKPGTDQTLRGWRVRVVGMPFCEGWKACSWTGRARRFSMAKLPTAQARGLLLPSDGSSLIHCRTPYPVQCSTMPEQQQQQQRRSVISSSALL